MSHFNDFCSRQSNGHLWDLLQGRNVTLIALRRQLTCLRQINTEHPNTIDTDSVIRQVNRITQERSELRQIAAVLYQRNVMSIGTFLHWANR